MVRHTLYAYAVGKDLHVVADEIEQRVVQFIRETPWRFNTPFFIDQRAFEDPSLGTDNLPDWELGLNYDLPDPPLEPPGWFWDIQQIASFFGSLFEATGRKFVIGIGDNERGITEDLFSIESGQPDLARLRRIIGVADTTN